MIESRVQKLSKDLDDISNALEGLDSIDMSDAIFSICRQFEKLVIIDESSTASYVQASMACLHFFCDKYLPQQGVQCPINTDKLMKAVFELTDAKIKKYESNRSLGELVYLLWHFGCSKKQAYEAVAHHFNCSETKVKTSFHAVFKDRTRCRIVGQFRNIRENMKNINLNNFPKDKHYNKAVMAYNDLERFLEIEESIDNTSYDETIEQILANKFPVVLERCIKHQEILKSDKGTSSLPEHLGG